MPRITCLFVSLAFTAEVVLLRATNAETPESAAVQTASGADSRAEAAESVAAPAGDQIRLWIDQLGSEQFAQRETASRQLAAAGVEAIDPLAAALKQDDFEVASRAMEILRGHLDGDDEPLAAAAETRIESAAEGASSAISSMAIAALDFHHLGMADAARTRLESLGATVGEGFLANGSRGLLVVFNAGWRGGIEDLRLVTRLRGVVQIALHGVPVDEPTLALLGRLRSVESFQFYGTGVSDAALAELSRKLPDARLDVRKGGKLGVGGQPMLGPCLITQVQQGSAADKAGLQIGDIVVRIDGQPVANFDALTDKVGRHAPGDRIELDIERSLPGQEPERFSRSIPLDGWE